MSVTQEEFDRFKESQAQRMADWERRQEEYERRREQERAEWEHRMAGWERRMADWERQRELDRAAVRREMRDLRRAGLRFIRDIQSQIQLLIDGQLRIEDGLERLEEQNDATAKSLQAFIDSMRIGGDGHRAPPQG